MKLLILGIITLLLSGCFPDGDEELKGFSKYLKKSGYSFYNPPRGDRGPGSVFRVAKSLSGEVTISPVCRQLYPDIEVDESPVSVPKEKSKFSIGLDFGISLLDGLIDEGASASLEGKVKKTIDVAINKATSASIYEEDMYSSDGGPRAITPSCYSRLRDLKEKDELHENVFVIQETLRADSFSYEFHANDEGGAAADFDIKKVVNVRPEVKIAANDNVSLQVNEPRHLAFKAFLITDFVETGLTGSGSAILEMQKLGESQIKSMLNGRLK